MLGGAKIGGLGGATRGARSVDNDSFIIKILELMMTPCQSRCAGHLGVILL